MSPRGPRAALVTVGDELLSGQTVDTNAAWLGRRLASLGIPVWYRHTVGDDEADIRGAVSMAVADADLVVVTGGLGPTRDDRTRGVVAQLFGRPLQEDPWLVEELNSRFRKLGYEQMPEANRSQAQVPRGASVLRNRLGTAPGLAFDEDHAVVVLLPGVPREMRDLFDEQVVGVIRERLGDRLAPVQHRVLHTAGIAESKLSELVEMALSEDPDPVSVAFLPDVAGVDLRLTVQGELPARAAEHLVRVEAILAPVVEPWRFESASGDLVDAVVEELRGRDLTLAVAESCTGGLISRRLTGVPGVSNVFLGGVVAYANAVKQDLLGVPPTSIQRYGAVSEQVARAMVTGVVDRCGADVGIAVTGIAGPGGGTDEKPVGTVWTAVSYGGEVRARLRHFTGDRLQIQARAAQDALRMARDMILGRVAPSEP